MGEPMELGRVKGTKGPRGDANAWRGVMQNIREGEGGMVAAGQRTGQEAEARVGGEAGEAGEG